MSQVSVVHGLASLQLSGVPAVHTPVWQVSAPLHTVPSAHEVPLETAACWQPESGRHESTVHAFASLQSSGVPAAQVPPWQVSRPLHALLSAHAVPLATGVCWQPLNGLHASTVHGFASSQTSGV